MFILHIENSVRDYDSWRGAFDKFERFRADQGVQSYRLARKVEDGNQVVIDLVFDAVEQATAFQGALEQIWRTPASRQELAAHGTAVVHEVAVERTLAARTPVISAAVSSTA